MANETTTTAQATTPAVEVKTDTTAAAPAAAVETKTDTAQADKPNESAKVEIKTETEKTKETVLTEGKQAAEPIKYELKLPKDSLLDPAHVAKIEAEAKAEGLTNEQAQARLARDSQLKAEVLSQQQASLKEQSTKWVDELKSDKDFGGDNFKENVAHAQRALDRFADPAFKKILDDTGLGNNPHLVRAFARVGKMMGNDKLVTGKTGGAAKPSMESRLYPTMKKQE